MKMRNSVSHGRMDQIVLSSFLLVQEVYVFEPLIRLIGGDHSCIVAGTCTLGVIEHMTIIRRIYKTGNTLCNSSSKK